MDKALAMFAAALDQATERGLTPTEAMFFLTVGILLERFTVGLFPTKDDIALMFQCAEADDQAFVDMAKPLAEAVVAASDPDPYAEIRDWIMANNADSIKEMTQRHASVRLAFDRKLVEVSRGMDLSACSPEFAARFAESTADLEKLFEATSPVDGEVNPLEEANNDARTMGTIAR